MYKIAIIGLSTLETSGVRNILEDYRGVHSENHLTVEELDGRLDEFDRYIVSVNEIIRHLEYFMPRKGRVIAVSSCCGDSSSSFATIYFDTDLTEIISMFDNLLRDKQDNGKNDELTSREVEVLKQLVTGITVKEIADKLCISAYTVITHRKNISAKLGIRSVSGLSLYAMMHGII